MPGRRLNDVERHLWDFWENPPQNFPHPLLRQIRIEGEHGLRGIHSLVVPIPYPLTAICGRNGAGKSTVLALAALSSPVPEDWHVYWGNARPRRRPGVRASYSFGDFFHRHRDRPPLNGLRVGWISLHRGNELDIVLERNGSRWRRLTDAGRHPGRSRRPSRPIDYMPVSRILPAAESGPVRSAFAGAANVAIEPLTQAAVEHLSYILGRTYDGAETRSVRGLGLPVCRAGSTYSGFDMGSGESSVITVLSRLQNLPTGGLFVVEELELGLHAEAQARLVEVLLRICDERRVQIICTTHSEVVLDHLPRQARVLMQKNGNEHLAVSDVSTRYAIHSMSGQPQPELMIYTEDRFAAVLVEEALAGPNRARIAVQDVGSNAALARHAVAHHRLNGPMRALSTFDGDCTDAQIERWIRDERAERTDIAPEWLVLPGDGQTPERWTVHELAQQEYLQEFSRELNCDFNTATAHVDSMRVQLDHHDAGFTLSRRTGLDQVEAQRLFVRAVARRHPMLDTLRNQVGTMLTR